MTKSHVNPQLDEATRRRRSARPDRPLRHRRTSRVGARATSRPRGKIGREALMTATPSLWQIRSQGRNGSLGRTLRKLRSRAAKNRDDFYAHRASWLAAQRRARRGHSKKNRIVVSVMLGHASRIAELEAPF